MIKILSANVFESSGNPKPEHIALIKTDPNQQIVQIQLNCQETHLIVLTCRKLASTNEFDYILNVYALESINFDSNNNSQVFLIFLFQKNNQYFFLSLNFELLILTWFELLKLVSLESQFELGT